MFGKKKKKDAGKTSDKGKLTGYDKESDNRSGEKIIENAGNGEKKSRKKSRKKNFFPIKKIIIFFLVLSMAASAGFFVYQRYFVAKSSDKTKTYPSIKLEHISLTDEILKFSFDYFPGLYASFVTFNHEIILIDGEITRIQAVGTRYPVDQNITDKERKIWKKTKDKSLKGFKKIQDKTEAVYVLFQVNRQQGMEKIKEVKQELESNAEEILKPVLKLTERLKSKSNVTIPKGFIKETIYRIRKKIGF